MHTTSSQTLLRTNLQILNVWSFFGFIQLIRNITNSCNYHVRIYKSHMHKYFYFCSLTKPLYKCCVQTYWSCIHKCISASYVIWLLIVSYMPWTQTKKHLAVNGTKTAVQTEFWKLWRAVVHVDTKKCSRISNSAAHTCKLNLKDNTWWKFV